MVLIRGIFRWLIRPARHHRETTLELAQALQDLKNQRHIPSIYVAPVTDSGHPRSETKYQYRAEKKPVHPMIGSLELAAFRVLSGGRRRVLPASVRLY